MFELYYATVSVFLVIVAIQLTSLYHKRRQQQEEEMARLTQHLKEMANTNLNEHEVRERRIDSEVTEIHRRIDGVDERLSRIHQELIKEYATMYKLVKK